MDQVFCCTQIEPFKSKRIDSEENFTAFLNWAQSSQALSTHDYSDDVKTALDLNATYVIQLVQQINYGPQDSKRYFLSLKSHTLQSCFLEVTERDLIEANFQKLNAYKNFRCSVHNRFFELNIYQKDPVNKHHWRANIARPAGDIDL